MNEKTKQYTLHIESGNYVVPTITISESDIFERWSIKFAWQSHKGDSGNLVPYYGFQVNVESRHANGIADAAKMLKKICPTGKQLTPVEMENRLRKLGFIRVVHDDRQMAKIPLDQVKPDGFRRYMSRSESGNCMSAVIARDEETAKVELIKRMAEHNVEKLTEWLERGAPIFSGDYSVAPVIRHLSEFEIGERD